MCIYVIRINKAATIVDISFKNSILFLNYSMGATKPIVAVQSYSVYSLETT